MPNRWTSRVFLSRAQLALFERGMPIFMLHKIAPPPPDARDPFEYVHPQILERKLASLVSAGLRPLSPRALGTQARESGFVLTLDDGYENVLKNALNILSQYQVCAIEFVVAGKMGGHNDWDHSRGERRERLMDPAQLREWLAAGHEIGSHSMTHPNLKRISDAQAREEIFSSKKLLEDTFGRTVSHFCYPSGKFDARAQDLVREAGYLTASTVLPGVNPPGQNPFELRRLSPLSGRELLAKARHRLWRNLRRAVTPPLK